MRVVIAFVLWVLSSAQVSSHEMTPAYPELRPSIYEGLNSTTMYLFNRRVDASYYEIGVFDRNWNSVPFATQNRMIEIDYLGKTQFEIFIQQKEKDRVEYICTTSKLLKSDIRSTGVTSRICSKIKRDEM